MIAEGKSNDLLVQQARWRLIGAFVLLVIALILVLVLFDREPPKRLEGVQLHFAGNTSVVEVSRREVNSRLDRGGVAPNVTVPKPSSAKVANNASSLSNPTITSPTTQKPKVQDEPPPQAIIERLVDDDHAEPADPESLTNSQATVKQKKMKVTSEKSPVKSMSNTPTKGRFVVRIGHFSDKSLAQSWAQKLNNKGVPAFIEQKRLADGNRILLRAGPFTDATQAEKAAKTAKNIGLLNAIVVRQ